MSAPAPAPPDIEEDIELDLEMDVEPGCEYCDGDAAWAMKLQVCNHDLILCSDCRIRIEQRRQEVPVLYALHTPCTVKNFHWTWRRL